jgi:hypothetical protein
MTTSLPSLSWISTKCGNFDVSQPHRPLQPITRIALPYPLILRLFIFTINLEIIILITFQGNISLPSSGLNSKPSKQSSSSSSFSFFFLFLLLLLPSPNFLTYSSILKIGIMFRRNVGLLWYTAMVTSYPTVWSQFLHAQIYNKSDNTVWLYVLEGAEWHYLCGRTTKNTLTLMCRGSEILELYS